MVKQRLDILVDTDQVTVELLGPKLARVVDPNFTVKVSENDIIRLSHDPGEAADTPHMVEILHKRNPVITKIEVYSGAHQNRMIALAAVLGAEILDIKETEYSSTIRIAHAEKIDVDAIADAAGVTDDFDDDDEEEENEEDEEETEEAEPQDSLDFDQYLKKPIFIPAFIWDDGGTGPFQGLCRGNGPIYDEKEWERTIGVFTQEGKYFAVVIDITVDCALPQFRIYETPFYFPIVSFRTMGAWVDPETGVLKLPVDSAQGQAAPESGPADDVKSAKVESGPQAIETTNSNDPQ